MNIKNITLAILADTLEMPVKPKIAAITEIAKNIRVQANIIIFPVFLD